MKYLKVVSNTDQINKQNIVFPVDGMANSLGNALADALRSGLPAGTPSHIGHDVHRLLGWSAILGIYLSTDIARQVGYIGIPESEGELQAIQEDSRRYWDRWRKEMADKFGAEMKARAGAPGEMAAIDFCHAAVLRGDGLASKLYPELFELESEMVDKDGLVDYRSLTSRFREIQPGVFHDSARGLVLFAHPYFRRSLSRMNTLNSYFLRTFADSAKRHPSLRVRLKLDPDMVGHPDSVRSIIELEYWRGPHFDADISKIPNGVTEYKASERTRSFEGVDKTQFWWKEPESRATDDKPADYRTFEAEELIENPSHGVSDQHFGCRYVHSEYASKSGEVSHFDGAIRTYDGEAYLARIDRAIDRAGKKSEYTKLFRFDGALPVDDWKSLCTDYFRGNDLLPEYFAGRSGIVADEAGSKNDPPRLDAANDIPGLAALVSFDVPPNRNCIFVVAEEEVTVEGQKTQCVELPEAATLRDFLSGLIDLSSAIMIEHPDKTVNFPRIILGRSTTIRADWQRVIRGLATAIRADAEADNLAMVSVAIGWQSGEILTTLSIAGKAIRVADLLEAVETTVDPEAGASAWIKNLKHLVKERSEPSDDVSDPTNILSADGILRIDHVSVEGKPPKLYVPRPPPADEPI